MFVALVAIIAASCGEDASETGSTESTSAPGEAVATTTTTTAAATTTTSPPPEPPADTSDVETSAPTIAPASTTAPATTDAPASGGSEDVPRWSTECVERVGDVVADRGFDSQLAAFTTVAAVPTLDLRLPFVETTADGSEWFEPAARTSIVPGGVVVGTYPPSGWPTPERITSSSLVAVDRDGTVRWRRCFDDVESRSFAVAPAALEPTTAWVITEGWQAPLQVVGVDLGTGADVPFPIDVTDRHVVGAADRFVLLGVRRDVEEIVSSDVLTLVDLLDGGTTAIPYPPGVVGRPASTPWFEIHDPDPVDDEVVVIVEGSSPGSARAAFVDGGWRDDAGTLRDVVPPTVATTFEEPFELRLVDGAGEVVWSVPEFHGPSREGFHWTVADDVVLAMRCLDWDPEGWCSWTDDGPPTEELVGFDRATGAELWTLPGPRAVPVLAGDRAIVTHDADGDGVAADGYVLIDLRTGESPAENSGDVDAWPFGAFAEECCGGDEFVHVRRDGAVVIATNSTTVRVWYPPEATAGTTEVDLTE